MNKLDAERRRRDGLPQGAQSGAKWIRNQGVSRLVLILVTALLVWSLQSAVLSNAYYDRGAVGVTLGQASVEMEEGGRRTISVSLSVTEDAQTKGCGMAECPQTCGEGCMDAKGQCICAGSDYQVYYPQVSVISSDNSIASASYSGGALELKGLAPGGVTVTVSVKMRQFHDSAEKISVLITPKPAASGQGAAPASSDAKTTGKDGGDASKNTGKSTSAGAKTGDQKTKGATTEKKESATGKSAGTAAETGVSRVETEKKSGDQERVGAAGGETSGLESVALSQTGASSPVSADAIGVTAAAMVGASDPEAEQGAETGSADSDGLLSTAENNRDEPAHGDRFAIFLAVAILFVIGIGIAVFILRARRQAARRTEPNE